jgi:predicted adenylyl cyclase CyaB
MQEVEVKIRLKKPAAVLRRLRKARFRLERRDWQRDIVLDQEHLELRAARRLLRLRRHSTGWELTFKGPPEKDARYKSREEIETSVVNGRKMELIFERLGFHIAFSYEKRRRTFRRGSERGLVTLDETPIGWYLELEGSRRWIDRTAALLGFTHKDYITKSYALLYREHCEARGVKPTHMLFKRSRPRIGRRSSPGWHR